MFKIFSEASVVVVSDKLVTPIPEGHPCEVLSVVQILCQVKLAIRKEFRDHILLWQSHVVMCGPSSA